MMTVGTLRLIFFFIYLCLATAAAVCDARTNRCPNALAFALALSSSALVGFSISERAFVHRLIFAAVLLLLLVIFELLWRRARGNAGFGMGDIKGILFHAVYSPTVCIYGARHRMRISLLVLFGSFAHARSFPSVSRPVFRLGPHIV